MHAKTFTKNNFRLSVVGASILLGIIAGCSKTPAELQKKFMSRGQHYLSEGKTNEAIIEFQNLLKVNPHLADGHYWIGKAYLKKGWTAESVMQFHEASKEDPLLLGPHLELAKYGVNSSQWSAVKPQIAAILKLDPNNLDGLIFSGQMAMAMGKENESQKDLEHALTLKPESVRALVAFGDLKRHQKHPKQAKNFYQKALDEDPNKSRAWAGLGLIAQTMDQSDEAATDFKKAVSVNPSDLRSRIILSNFMAQQGHVHKAIDTLKAVPAKAADLRIPIKIAEYETLIGENNEAIRLLLPLERQKVPISDIYFVLAKAYQKNGQKQDALHMVDRFLLIEGASPIMNVAAARITLFEGRPDETQKILESVKGLPNLPDTYYLTKGQVELALNHPAQALQIYNDALKIFPDDVMLLQNLAEVQTIQKNYKAAISILTGLLKKDPGNVGSISRMGVLLGRTQGSKAEIAYYQNSTKKNPGNSAIEALYLISMATNGKLQNAMQEAETFLGSYPDHQNLRFLLAQFYLQSGHKKRAIQTYKTILEKNPKNIQTLVALASQEFEEKHYPEAESLYRQAILLSPKNANLYVVLGKTLIAENQEDAASDAFQKALSYNPNQPFALLSMATIEIHSGQSKQALTYLAPLMGKKYPPQRRAEIQWLWGLAAENNGNMKDAHAALEKAIKLDPQNANYYASLGDFWASLSQWDKSLPEFQKSLELHPDNPLLVLKKNWVKIQLKKGKPDPVFVKKVITQALGYRKLHPDNTPAGLIAAEGNLLLQKPEEALNIFDSILSKHPHNQTALLDKSGILLGQGHATQARQLVEQLLATYPDNIQGNLMMASFDLKDNKIPEEVTHLEKVHQFLPDWIQPALALSSADLTLKRYAEAKSISLALHDSHPNLTAALYLKANAEMGLKEYQSALDDFKSLLKNTKNPGSIYFLMSMASIQLGDKKSEKQYLVLALKEAPNDPLTLNNMAFYLAKDENNLTKALVYAQKAVKLSPQPSIQDTMGYILFRMGNYSEAEHYFKMAYNSHLRAPEFLYHLGMNEWKLGKNNLASDYLKESIVSGELSPQEQENGRKVLKKLSSGT